MRGPHAARDAEFEAARVTHHIRERMPRLPGV
jgi:hypothetical protein